ncbi:MAG: hypothetical protein IGS49_21315 [Chlorogloeopsis fritschii C42_A2020_084]|uniref:DUF6463 family protein n=1 Tax=Chlorogloeopsis fritschii TaxID=1124 RepID=UPI001A0A061B|nr:DUF6463 family protein [Chlorogloeopsis fritschii]MBF2007912.1 hypothetical protein [Chlorogloeopsis fritschii C42_A2020_084]
MFRVSGYLLIAISIIHILVGILFFTEPLSEIVRNGVFNTTAPNPFAPYFDREDAFWFMMVSPLLFTLGQLCCWAEAQGISPPAFLGWNLLGFSVVGVVIEPISAFWLLILPAVLILIESQKVSTRLTKPTEDEHENSVL